MIMNEKMIKDALLKGERVTLECKRAKTEVPKELWNTYLAFANTIGGGILLGVEEHRKDADPDKRFEIIGVGNSKARNPRIQNMLRMVGFGENIGSGFPKIIAAWKETDWGEPELKNKIEVDEVELVLPVPATANGIKDDTKDGIKDSQKSSQKSSQKIIELIQENPNVTTSEMAEKIGVTRRAIAKITSALQAEGVIRRVGPDKGGHWEIIK